MFKTSHLIAALGLSALAALANAQTAADMTQRDINQESRIRNGLQDGSLTTREAALLEKREGAADRMQANALKDGKLSDAERARITRAENRNSRAITTARGNGIDGNPLSASSQRMQAGVQRDINQQQRIENGIQSGQLSNKEAGQLERGQARTDRQEFRAGRDGHVGAGEARAVNNAENQQSARIHNKRHNAVTRG